MPGRLIIYVRTPLANRHLPPTIFFFCLNHLPLPLLSFFHVSLYNLRRVPLNEMMVQRRDERAEGLLSAFFAEDC